MGLKFRCAGLNSGTEILLKFARSFRTRSAISVDFFSFLHFESVDLLENILSALKVILLLF